MHLTATETVLLVAQLVASLLSCGVERLRGAKVLSASWSRLLRFVAGAGLAAVTAYLTPTLDWRSLIIPVAVATAWAAVDRCRRIFRRHRRDPSESAIWRPS